MKKFIKTQKEAFNDNPLKYTSFLAVASILSIGAVYGYYNAEVVQLEVDVESVSEGDGADLILGTTQVQKITPYQASYVVMNGCNYIEVAEPTQRISDCRLSIAGL